MVEESNDIANDALSVDTDTAALNKETTDTLSKKVDIGETASSQSKNMDDNDSQKHNEVLIGSTRPTHSTPDGRSSFQSPLDEIVEVESQASSEDGNNVVVNLTAKLESLQDNSSSAHSWDKDNNDTPERAKVTTDDLVECSTEEEEAAKDEVVECSLANKEDQPDNNVDQPKLEAEPDTLNAKSNRSFEERMNVLHEKMENQLLQKLQHLEEKIAQSQQQKIESSAEESLQLKEETIQLKRELSESTTSVMQLRTEIATKDLEMLKLKQKVIHLESSLQASLEKPTTFSVAIGVGELNPDKISICEEDMLTRQAALEQDLADAKNQLSDQQKQIERNVKQLADAEERLKSTQAQLLASEQAAAEHKASCDSMMILLEDKAKDNEERIDSALVQRLTDEKHRSELALSMLKEELAKVQEAARGETSSILSEKESIRETLAAEQKRCSEIKAQLTDSIVTHESSLIELKAQYEKEMNEIRSSLIASHKSELQAVQYQLKEEQLARMEIEFKINETVREHEDAVEKRMASEAKLKAMTDAINEAETLRDANDKLHSSLQAETEKRKILHNTIEDMKGDFSPFYSAWCSSYVPILPINMPLIS